MIFFQLKEQLQHLDDLLSRLNERQFTINIQHLGNASIGEHSRHIIELLQCALNGYHTGCIDYINRQRNLQLQQNIGSARKAISHLMHHCELPDKSLNILVENTAKAEQLLVITSYFREMVYNTEHTIHHLALIKVALVEMELHLVDATFGLAYSTIKYQAAKA